MPRLKQATTREERGEDEGRRKIPIYFVLPWFVV